MSGLKSIVFTAACAASVGIGVVAAIVYFGEPAGSIENFWSVPLAGSSGMVHPAVALPEPAAAPAAAPASASASPPTSETPRPTADAGFVLKQQSVELEDGVTLQAFVLLAPAMEGGTPPGRVLVADLDFEAGGVSLQTAHVHAVVGLADSRRVGGGAEFDLNAALRAAAKLLGADDSPFAAARTSPFYNVLLAPRPGLTWGGVVSEEDLVLTVTHEP